VGIGGRGEGVAGYLHDRACVAVGCAVWFEVSGVEVNLFDSGDEETMVAVEVELAGCIIWRLGFRQSSFSHIARVPQHSASDA
jgi:hypothetical protein